MPPSGRGFTPEQEQELVTRYGGQAGA
jgi:hypothetical protein